VVLRDGGKHRKNAELEGRNWRGALTTCDPTCRPAILYIATIFAVLWWFEGREKFRDWIGSRVAGGGVQCLMWWFGSSNSKFWVM